MFYLIIHKIEDSSWWQCQIFWSLITSYYHCGKIANCSYFETNFETNQESVHWVASVFQLVIMWEALFCKKPTWLSFKKKMINYISVSNLIFSNLFTSEQSTFPKHSYYLTTKLNYFCISLQSVFSYWIIDWFAYIFNCVV